MNTFVLAIVALGLVAFLIISKRRRAAAGSAPAERSSASKPSLRRRRRGAEPSPIPPMTAMAEPAAPSLASPAYETPPLERIAPPIPDWTPHEEMIVEPGWPLPGEIAGSWSTEAAPTASPGAVEEPPELEPDAVDISEEWTMPAAPYGEADTEPEPGAEAEFPAELDFPSAPDAADGDIETWVPGVSEIDSIAFAEPEAEPAPEAGAEDIPEPVAVWAEAEAEITAAEAPPLWVSEPAALTDDADDEPTGPPLWTPPADIPEPDEPAEALVASFDEPAVAFEEPPVAVFEEPAEIAVEEPAWEIAPALPTDPIPAADLEAQSQELADLLPRATSGLRPLLSVSDALGVTPRMLVVVHTLAECPLSLPEQARALGVSRPVVADICARLEQLGFVHRERDARDRRRTLVALTDKGRRLADETTTTPEPAEMGSLLERLSPTERDALLSALRSLSTGVTSVSRPS